MGLLGALEAARHGRLAVSAARIAGVAAYARHRVGVARSPVGRSPRRRPPAEGVAVTPHRSHQKLSIVIVTFNCADDVEGCLRSIASNPPPCEHEIVVIDNNSSDGTRDRVRAVPGVRLIERPDNAGYGTAVNEAVATTDGSHLLFLNPDTIITRGSLGAMLAALASAPVRVGVVGPRLMLTTGEPQLSARRFPAPGRLWAEVLRLHRMLPARLSSDGRRTGYFPPDVSGPVDWVSGACHLIPREVWDRAGALTEETFLGFDDLEYCWRLHQLGYATWFCADAEVIHECSAAVGERWSLIRVEELAIHNFYVIATDYLSWPERKLLNAAEIVGALSELVVAQGKGVDSLSEDGSRRARIIARIRLLSGLFFGRIRPIRRCEPSNDRPPVVHTSATYTAGAGH
ncbi:MAG: glycosyltransferase family 2 protein [Actinomycetota bacterium]|nr:glycosyltransferase family 2 protein [Actinomycetota bacterium]